jgi:hypothetical protein
MRYSVVKSQNVKSEGVDIGENPLRMKGQANEKVKNVFK